MHVLASALISFHCFMTSLLLYIVYFLCIVAFPPKYKTMLYKCFSIVAF